MNISIVGRQFDLTDSIKAHIESAVDTLNKFNLDIISARVVVSGDEKNGKKGFSVEMTINLPNKNTVVIKQKDKDVYAAVDLAIERVQKVLRRHHDKIKDHKAESIKDIGINDSDDSIIEGDEIIPVEQELYKPMEIEEALIMLKESTNQFFVFNDKDGDRRVIYKISDGKFGLY
jgi:putative sigma-54 modulation protein